MFENMQKVDYERIIKNDMDRLHVPKMIYENRKKKGVRYCGANLSISLGCREVLQYGCFDGYCIFRLGPYTSCRLNAIHIAKTLGIYKNKNVTEVIKDIIDYFAMFDEMELEV